MKRAVPCVPGSTDFLLATIGTCTCSNSDKGDRGAGMEQSAGLPRYFEWASPRAGSHGSHRVHLPVSGRGVHLNSLKQVFF